MNLRIELLADHPTQVMRLGQWMHQEWPMPGRSVADRAALFMMCMNRGQVPMTFVAMAEGEPAGTVSLLDRSVASHEHLHPWVASLYVGRQWRNGGLATRLVETAAAAARRLGVATIYIGVAGRARQHYEQQGWRYLGEGQVADDPADRVDVLHRALR